VLLGIRTGSMFRLYLSLTGTHSFITMSPVLTNVAMYEIPHSKLRCIDCRDSEVAVDGYQLDHKLTLHLWCEVCDNRWRVQVTDDE